jgi:glutamate dehydrogenase
VADRFPDAVRAHPLRREIVAAEATNALVDRLGTVFVSRLTRDTGVAMEEALRAWAIAWTVAGGERLADALAATALAADAALACQLALEGLAARVAKWVLANADPGRAAADVAAELRAAAAPVRRRLAEWVVGAEAESLQRRIAELELAGLGPALARELAGAEWLPGALDVAAVARAAGIPPETAAARYYALGQQIDFPWLLGRLAEAGDDDGWQRRAAEGLVEDVLDARRRLARLPDPVAPQALGRLETLVRDLRVAPRAPLAALQVVAHELRRLAQRLER